MRHHSDSIPRDALNDYLDSLAGALPPDSRAGDLNRDLRDDVDRFFDLAERAGMAPDDTRRPTMNTTLPASTALSKSQRRSRRNVSLPAWTRHLHLASTGLLIVVVIALSFAAFGPNGIGNNGTGSDGSGDEPSLNGAVPVATVPEDAVTSSIPYPTADECTVEAPTEQEIIDMAIEGAMGSGYAVSRIDNRAEPTEAEAAEIMGTFREFQACQMKGEQYVLAMMTPFGIAQSFKIMHLPGEGTPITAETITERIDAWLVDADELPRTPAPTAPSPFGREFPSTPFPEGVNELGTPVPAQPTMAPIGFDAFPESAVNVLTMFPEDIEMIDEHNARAVAYWVNPTTREVQYFEPRVLRLTQVDGRWLIDGQRDGLAQG